MNEITRYRAALDNALDSFDAVTLRELSMEAADYIDSVVVEHPPAFSAALERSLDTFDSERTSDLCEELIKHLGKRQDPYPPDDAVKLLGLLRRKRRFEHVLDVADSLLQQGCDTPKVNRLYAQALIDSGHLSASIHTLRQLEAQCRESGDQDELTEAHGLLGRAWKQIYCTGAIHGARRQAALETAERFYAKEFRRNEGLLWHGINSCALQQRATRDKLASFVPSTGSISGRDIITRAGTSDPSSRDVDVWTRATVAEAHVAENDMSQALDWIVRYVESDANGHSAVDAFEIASTLRQFEEVWQLDVNDPAHARILEVLRAALLDREGGSVSLADAHAESAMIDTLLRDESYEQILGRDRFRNLGWYRKGLERASSVCKFVDQLGEGFGTGFLVQAEDLGLAHAARWVVLTNAHVISESAEEQSGIPAAVPPDAATLMFEASEFPTRVFTIDRVLAQSPRRELDFSVLALAEEGDFPDPYPIARRLPLIDRNQRIYVIGHPKGGNISFSLNDNLLLDHEAPRVHYRSPTEGGSSGSPLFNQNWELIGLHHAGGKEMPRLNGQSGRYPANEGLWIQSIREAIDSMSVR